MPRKRKNPGKLRPDLSETAFRVVQEAIGERPKTVPPAERTDAEKDATAVERGRNGGQSGGKSRAEKLLPKRRAEIAKKAAEERWRGKGQ